jgi:hypothetical protein
MKLRQQKIPQKAQINFIWNIIYNPYGLLYECGRRQKTHMNYNL